MSTRPSGHGKSAIMVVDADAASLAVIIEEVRTRYGRDYDVLSHSSAPEALAHVRALSDSGQEVALVLADQWLARMSGVDLLAEMRQVAPTARRALLIQWGDRSTAGPIMRASALGHIDCYLPKPVYAPDERFHRTVTELLDEWWRLHGRWFEVVRVVGEEHSARAHQLRDVPLRNGLPVGLYTPDSVDGKAILREAGAIDVDLPAVVLYDGRVLANPSNSEVATTTWRSRAIPDSASGLRRVTVNLAPFPGRPRPPCWPAEPHRVR